MCLVQDPGIDNKVVLGSKMLVISAKNHRLRLLYNYILSLLNN